MSLVRYPWTRLQLIKRDAIPFVQRLILYVKSLLLYLGFGHGAWDWLCLPARLLTFGLIIIYRMVLTYFFLFEDHHVSRAPTARDFLFCFIYIYIYIFFLFHYHYIQRLIRSFYCSPVVFCFLHLFNNYPT